MKSILSIITIALPLSVVFSAIPTIAQANSSEGFILPSKKIYCRIAEFSNKPASNYLRCEIASQLKPMPVQPKSCNLDWGNGLVLSKTRKAEVTCAGDTLYSPSLPTLNYGKTWRKDGFTCTSAATGLTCTNRQNKGFFLNRQEWRSF